MKETLMPTRSKTLVRVIVVTEALRAGEAVRMGQSPNNAFIPEYVYSGMCDRNSQGKVYPRFYIVRRAREGEDIVFHNMNVKVEELLASPYDYDP